MPRSGCTFAAALVVAVAALAGTPAVARQTTGLREQLRRPQPSLPIALPDGRVLRFATETENLGRGATGIRGTSADGAHLIAFAGGDGSVRGNVYASGGRFRLDRRDGVLAWRRVLPEGSPPAEDPPVPAATASLAPAPRAAPGPDGQYEIDVLLLYTQRYPAQFSSRAEAVALLQESIFNANAYFRNSGMPVHYRVVGIESYNAQRVYSVPDFGAEPGVIARRNATGADLVAMIEGGTKCLGQAQLFNGSQQTADDAPPSNVDPERDAFAFVLLQPPSVCHYTDWLVAHELGHTVGGGHEMQYSSPGAVPYTQLTPDLSEGGGYWKEFAHGVRCGNAGANGVFKYDDIMTYDLETEARNTDIRGDFFSSPHIVRDGETCGSDGVPGLEPTRSDNARSITLAAPYVAAYRQPVDRGS